MADEYHVAFSFEYHSFEVVVAPDLKSVTATMRNPAGDTSSVLTLQAQLSDACCVPMYYRGLHRQAQLVQLRCERDGYPRRAWWHRGRRGRRLVLPVDH